MLDSLDSLLLRSRSGVIALAVSFGRPFLRSCLDPFRLLRLIRPFGFNLLLLRSTIFFKVFFIIFIVNLSKSVSLSYLQRFSGLVLFGLVQPGLLKLLFVLWLDDLTAWNGGVLPLLVLVGGQGHLEDVV